jgi:16S rRNA U516 pseudouridylate synthase RsuA-like enzyme
VRIGGFKLGDLSVGKWKILPAEERKLVMAE